MRACVAMLCGLGALAAAGCGTPADPIEPRSAVRGAVTVAGKPAPGLVVRFHLDAGTADERAPRLVETLTDADGTFRVSQNRPDDGLAPGKYTVTFFWPPGGDAAAAPETDQLRGRYLRPERSQQKFEVQSQPVTLPTFDLK